jgi:predicted ArsR family transcriptional regulator
MDFFDERVLAALRDGEPRSFTALLSQGGFSHNTLQQHLRRLMAQGLVLKEKEAANGFGRPKFAYHIPSKTTNKSFLHLKTHVWNWWLSLLVALGIFADLKRAVTVKKQRGLCAPILPPNQKIRIITT